MNFRLLFVFILISCAGVAQPILLDKVIAVVGKYPMLLSEVEANFIQQKQQRTDLTDEDKCHVYEDMLFQKLLLAQADRDSVVASDNEVDGELNRRIQYYVGMLGSEEKFEEFYGKRVSAFKDELRDDVRNQLVAQKMQQKITGDTKLTPSEVRTFFGTLNVDSLPIVNSEVEIGQIVKRPSVTDQAKKEAREQLEIYRQRVINGESMSVLCALYSEDPGSAKNGGRYESVMRGQFVPEFEAVAFRLKAGEISEIFESPYGYHFIELVARKGESVDVRHLLIAPKISPDDVVRAKIELDSIQQMIIRGQISFADAALKYSDDKDTKHNGGLMINPASNSTKWEIDEVGQMDQNMVFMLDKMEVGDVSTPMQYATPDAKQAWRIITLKSRTEPHKANIKDDYTRLLNMATYVHQKKAISDWISKKSKITYIKLDPTFSHCKLEHNWTINN
ncbi:MAG: peptidylprolyl isomerase [Bacteroidetes bacterium]|nr:peptidylprolyl isomerase [Bacteroidota bacterium]